MISVGKDGVLLVTNYHVIAEGDDFKAVFPSDSGRELQVGGLEVVKTDTENDLALLSAPNVAGIGDGLETYDAGVTLGQHVAAMGYPYVAGSEDFTLTFEPGDVSAVKRVMNDHEYVQTNANINPGNSGGPVVDACARVVGIVVATSTRAQRVGLVIPVQRLVELEKKYAEPAPPPKQAIAARLTELEEALEFDKGRKAASLFSRKFMRRVVMPDFMKHIRAADQREGAYAEMFRSKGIDYYKASMKTRIAFLKDALPRAEFQAWLIAQLLGSHRMGVYEAMGGYLSMWVTTVFGNVRRLDVVEVSDVKSDHATADVKITTTSGETFWSFPMVREWGDWRIEDARCVRGCHAG